jgi:hypothetical protein
MGLASCPTTPESAAVSFKKCDNTVFNPAVDKVATCADIPAFATPAETIAGTATNLIVNPADLTAKLANQPAAGACTDRDDVVWNGTILQGAAKHYTFTVSIPRVIQSAVASAPTFSTITQITSIVLTNPSSCRSLRVAIRGGTTMQPDANIGQVEVAAYAFLNGVAISNLGGEANVPVTSSGVKIQTGGGGSYDDTFYHVLPPSTSATYGIGHRYKSSIAGNSELLTKGSIYASTI